MHILKKGIVLIPVIAAALIAQASFAMEKPLELKKSCIKDNPLADGDSDPELIGLYSQICDKKNKKNNELMTDLYIQAAQKYQELGYSLKALQAVNQLRKQNINRQELTDVEFLAGIAISQNALNYMRTVELRALTDTAYAPAKKLAETVRFAQPAPDSSELRALEKANKLKASKTYAYVKNSGATQKIRSAGAVKTGSVKVAKASKPAAGKAPPAVKTFNASSSSPFDSLNKK